jgi:nucleotide-binding universal stress UspA family protein
MSSPQAPLRVLIPLDGSDFGLSVLPTATALLRLIPAAELHLLTVLNPRDAEGSFERPVIEAAPAVSGTSVFEAPSPATVENRGEALERLRTESADWLQDLAATHFAGIATTRHVLWERSPAVAIVAQADEIHASLILMPTHGRSGLSHLVTGSVTEAVIRTAGRPVLVVGPSRQSS